MLKYNSEIRNGGDINKKGISESGNKTLKKITSEKTTILFVEDGFHIREIIRINLEMNGYNVLLANDGKEALKVISRQIPDLIISDILMPNMDGVEFFLALKERAETSHIPVIFLTVKGQVEDKKTASILGVDEYITKPFDPRDLENKIRKILENR